MTSRERLLQAINKGQPNRLPVTTHHLMPSFLHKYMNNASREEFFRTFGFEPIHWAIAYTFYESRGEYYDPLHPILVFSKREGFPPADGDFNLDPASPAHELFCGQAGSDSLRGIFSDCWQALAKPEKDAGTSHNYTGTKRKKRIDWILTTPEFRTKKISIIYDNDNRRYPSDHDRVFATLASNIARCIPIGVEQ